MNSWARPGVKCVCVDASAWPTLTKGDVYTVTVTGIHARSGRPVLWLEEASSGGFFGVDPGFYQERFRPLITKTQDVDLELFKHHLGGVGVDA